MNRAQNFRCTGLALGVLLALAGSAAAQTPWPTPAYLSPDGKLVLVQVPVNVEKNKYKWAVCGARTGKQVVLLEGIAANGSNSWARTGAFSPDGKSLLFGDKLWDISTGKAGPKLDKSTLFGHDRPVFSPDGKMLVTFDENGTVRLRNAVTLEVKSEWRMPSDVAFSARGGRLALVALIEKMPTLIVVETATGKQVAAHELPGVKPKHRPFPSAPSPTLALSADGQLVAVVRKTPDQKSDELAILKVADGKPAALLPAKGSTGWKAVAFSLDGKTFAAGGSDGELRKDGVGGEYFHEGSEGAVTLWDTATWERRGGWIEERGRVHTLHFAPDGVLVANVILPGDWRLHTTDTRFLCLRDPASGRELAAVPVRREATGIQYDAVPDVSSDGRVMIASSVTEAMLVDLGAGPREVAVARKHVGAVMGLAFSPDGAWLASAGADRTVRLWQAASLKQHAVLTGHRGTVLAVAFAAKDPWIASAGADGFLRLWEVPAGKPLHALRAHGDAPVSCVAFSADGTLASGGFDGLVKLWHAAKGEARTTLTPAVERKGEKPRPIASLAFSRDAASLAVGSGDPIWSDSRVEIWDVSRRERKSRWPGPFGLRGLAFGADADTLFVAGTTIHGTPGDPNGPGPGLVELRQSSDGKTAKVARGLRHYGSSEGMLCVAVSPNGKVLAAGSGAPTSREPFGQIILADAATLKLLPAPLLPAGVSAVALFSDGRLAVADVEGVIRMYQLNAAP